MSDPQGDLPPWPGANPGGPPSTPSAWGPSPTPSWGPPASAPSNWPGTPGGASPGGTNAGGSGWNPSGGRSSTPSGPPLRPLDPTPGYGAPTPSPGDGPSAGRGLKIAVAILAATCLLLAGVAIGAFANRTTTVAASGAVTPAVNPSTPTPGGTVPVGDEPAAAVAVALRPAVVQLNNLEGLGSGVVFDADRGLILTNAHVVEGSTTMTVVFEDSRKAKGTVLGSDTEADIAVVQVDASDAKGMVAARLDDGKVLAGQMAIAIGSPFGFSESVTAGIISAVDRPIPGNSSVTINMIQTDAPINPGNSGGALANRSGNVIGINTAIFSQSGDNSGIGFAIPIQTAKAIADKIVAGGSLAHGYLGVTSSPPDSGSAGAEVATVAAGSPAEQSGLQVGDVITKVDDDVIRSPEDLAARIVVKNPGDTIRLVVVRDGVDRMVTATLTARTASPKRTTTTTR